MKRTNFISILLFLFITSAHPQEVISTAGNQGVTASGSLNWTVGEPLIEILSDGAGTLTQGFQQSNLTITAIKDLKVPGIELSVYPNPTHDFLSVEVKTGKQVDLILNLIDLNGKLLLQKRMTENLEILIMQHYSPATYILKITGNNLEIQTYEIVKQ